VLFDDYILRQIQKVGELLAMIAAGARGQVDPGIDDALEDAYRALLGLDAGLADSLSPSSLLRMLHEPDTRRVLVELVAAHGDLCLQRDDVAGAVRRWRRALALLAEVGGEPAAVEAIEARIAGHGA
jgi:hypothetical protein